MDNYQYHVVDKSSIDFTTLMNNPLTKKTFVDIIKNWYSSGYTYNNIITDNRQVRYSLTIQNSIVVAIAIGGPSWNSEPDMYYISHVYTIDGCTRLGLCEKTMYNLVDSYWDYNQNRISNNNNIKLEVAKANLGAKRCYEKIGFTITDTSDPTYDWMQLQPDLYRHYYLNLNLKELSIETNKHNNGTTFNIAKATDMRQKIRRILE